MENITKSVEQYLKYPSNYAILLEGKWGSGKTFFYKNTIEKLIKETPSQKNHSKNLIPVYISLYGLTSIEEIQTQIFLSLYQFLNSRKVKLGSGILKLIARGAFRISRAGDLDKYLRDANKMARNLIDIDRLVLCFDDLERKGETLSLKAFIGFVNSIVENEDGKVIIVANHDKIEEGYYKDLKEKTIGITIPFEPDFRNQFQIIIDHRFRDSKSFRGFINDHQEFILGFKDEFNGNLRSLIFTLDNIHTIYSLIKTELIDIGTEMAPLVDENIEEILRLIIAFSIEYKHGRIQSGDREEFDYGGFPDLASAFSYEASVKEVNPGEQEKTLRDQFIDKYFGHPNNYKYFKSIFDSITRVNVFDIDRFKEDFRREYRLTDEKIPHQYEVLNKLGEGEYFKLTDTEYEDLTKEMVELAKKGLFELSDYLVVFQYAVRFGNMFDFDKDKLLKKFKGVVNSITDTDQVIEHREASLQVSEENPDYVHLKDLHDDIINRMDILEKTKKEKEAQEVLDLLDKDLVSFAGKLQNKDNGVMHIPIFKYASENVLLTTIKGLSNPQIRYFTGLIRHRYRKSYAQSLKEEKVLLMKLLASLRDHIKTLDESKLSKKMLKELAVELELAVKELGEDFK